MKPRTLLRLLKSARVRPRSDSILLHMGQGGRIAGIQSSVCVKTADHVMRVVGNMGSDVFVDLGPQNRDAFFRFHNPGQCWSLTPWPDHEFDLAVSDDPCRLKHRCRNLWTIDYRMPPTPTPDPLRVHVPYGMSTWTLLAGTARRIRSLRSTARRLKVLFVGNFTAHEYSRTEEVVERFGKDNRATILKHLLRRTDTHEVGSWAELEAVAQSGKAPQVVVLDSGKSFLPPERWFDVLAMAEHFLCPPGMVMPLCHNLIEAMSVGTIPITNYPEWLAPRLADGTNCLTFDSLDGLDAAVDRAIRSTPGEVRDRSAAAIAYHDSHCDPALVAARVKDLRHEPVVLEVIDETAHRVQAQPRIR